LYDRNVIGEKFILFLTEIFPMKEAVKYFLARKMVGRKRARSLPLSDLETLHLQPEVPGYNDSIYFSGWQNDGLSFVTRQAFRSDKHNENWLKIHIPGEGVWGFENRDLPDGQGFAQGPLEYLPNTPGIRWQLKYKGPVFKDDIEEEALVDISWEGIGPVIDFDRQGALLENTARQIARQPWNREFFRKLRELHKVHYEQAGRVAGTIVFRGQEYVLSGHGVRDHSFGRRSWEGWDRHLWYLGVLEDGRYFNASIIDYDFIKDLKAGYLGDASAAETLAGLPSFAELSLKEPLPVEVVLPLQIHPGEEKKLLKVKMIAFFPFLMDDTYHIRQALAHFTLDGVPGMGIAEMGINTKKHDVDLPD